MVWQDVLHNTLSIKQHTFADIATYRLVDKEWNAACSNVVAHIKVQFWDRLRQLDLLLVDGDLSWKSSHDISNDTRAYHFVRRLLLYRGYRMKRLSAANLKRALKMIDVKASTTFRQAITKKSQLQEFECNFLNVHRKFSDGFCKDMYFGIFFIFDPSFYKPAQTFDERRAEIELKYVSSWDKEEAALNAMLRKFRKSALLS